MGPDQPNSVLLSLDTFGVIANMGLIFFMFLMGLELEAKEMTQMWKKSLPIAGLSSLLRLLFFLLLKQLINFVCILNCTS
jgi:Kef-type K+ transport system membrane component KefB